MSLKEELYTALEGHGIKYINVNRDGSEKGKPVVQIEVYARNATRHLFSFDKGNRMTAEHMAKVIVSYLRNRT